MNNIDLECLQMKEELISILNKHSEIPMCLKDYAIKEISTEISKLLSIVVKAQMELVEKGDDTDGSEKNK